ncbi:MAG: hypothetical protein KF902_11355 [Phycisphaeraceae bacterium]|nr:hypothetical protein [Phycisphaeraceae bacterium]
MDTSPRHTDERLKSWLDTNQLDQERLCQALLSIDGRFTDVRPRQPRGGPDGGRDLEAMFQNNHQAWIAIGFKVSATDSATDRKWAADKFKSDLASAMKMNADLDAFVFMTNITLTVTQRNTLISHANSQGIAVSDILDRERMRILLDSPDGLSIRFQYLGINLSDAEQAAFFSRWGNRIEDIVRGVASRIDTRIDRVQFMLEQSRPLRHISVVLYLKPGIALPPSTHFRLLCQIYIVGTTTKHNRLVLAACDESSLRPSTFSGGSHNCILYDFDTIACADSSQPAPTPRTSGAMVWPDQMNRIIASGGFSEWTPDPDIPTLSSLDCACVGVFVNSSIAQYIDRLELNANEYTLWSAARSELAFDSPNSPPTMPWQFSDDELADVWVRIMSSMGMSPFRFSDTTPRRRFQAAGSDRL